MQFVFKIVILCELLVLALAHTYDALDSNAVRCHDKNLTRQANASEKFVTMTDALVGVGVGNVLFLYAATINYGFLYAKTFLKNMKYEVLDSFAFDASCECY